MRYNEKVIVAGDIIEHFRYERYIEDGFKLDEDKPKGRSCDATPEEKLVNRWKVMQRARSTLRRLVCANAWQWVNERGQPYSPIFMTLTFAKNIHTFDEANPEFRRFIWRLSYYVLGERSGLQYVCVPEFQKRGAIHYHVIFFNLPYIPASKIEEIWRNGFVKLNKIDNVDNVGAYICKYMGKDLEDERLFGKKCYFSSRGLKKPLEIKDKHQVQDIVTVLPGELKKYETSFTNDYTGKIVYTQYNLTRWQYVCKYRRIRASLS